MKFNCLIILFFALVLYSSGQDNTWTGAVSRDWQTAGNWSLGHVPLITEDVVVPPGTTHTILLDEPCSCHDMTLQSSAEMELIDHLYLTGDSHIFGTITISHTDASFFCHSISWESGSSLVKNFTYIYPDRPFFRLYGDLFIESGSDVVFDTMVVAMRGTSDAIIKCNSPTSSIHQLEVEKDNATVTFSALSAADLKITKYFFALDYTGPTSFISSSSRDIFVGNEDNIGYMYATAHLQITGGTLKIYSNSDYIEFSPADTINNLTLQAINAPLEVNGSPHILGNLTAYGYPTYFDDHITLEGHLSNELTDPSTLEFNLLTMTGSNIQSIDQGLDSDTLTVNKSSGDVRLLNGTMGCNQYDWIEGGINVLGGTFTADNLIDDGIYGKFWLSTGGTINLINTDGYVDLNAEIHIYGGTMNVYGGTDDSYWGYDADCILDMDDGVLDFKDRGIRLDNNYNVDEDITGGVIRTTMGFHGPSRTDFNPTAGIFEFYGTSDYTINQGPGNTFHSIEINKAVTTDHALMAQPVLKNNPRSPWQNPPGGGNRSNIITLSSDLYLTGDMVITTGVLDVSTSNYDIYIEGNWTNDVGDAGFIERNGIVEFQGATNSQILTDETFFNLKENKTSTLFRALELGTGDNNGVDVNVLSTLILQDGELELNSPCTLSVSYMLQIDNGANLNANDVGTIHIMVGQNWNNNNPAGAGFYSGSASVVEFNSTNPAQIQFVKEASAFNDIIINSVAPSVRPEGSSGFGIIHCQDMEILLGRLTLAGEKVIVDGTLDVYDELELSSSTDSLIVNDIHWKAGSDDSIVDGRIMVGDDWIFEDGTDAELGTGNMTEFYVTGSSIIECFDATASFGNIDLNKPSGSSANTSVYNTSTQPMRVSGDVTVRAGNHFFIENDTVFINGSLVNEAGCEIAFDGNAYMEINEHFHINGLLDLGTGYILVHDFYDLENTGTLILDGGTLITDTPNALPYWCYFEGTLTMTDGILEATYNHHRFTSTFSGTISGGSFRVGGAFNAADNVFQPTAGTVEFINGAGHYIQPSSGNWFYNLHFNNDGIRDLVGPMTVLNDLLISAGGFDANTHDIDVGGDWTNNVGSSAFNEATSTVYFNGDDPLNAQHIYGETFYNLANDNYSGQLEITGNTTVTNDFNAGAVGAKTFVSASSFSVLNMLDLSDATLILASSGPDVEAESFIQGGILEVDGGSFTANDLVDSYLKGTYNISGGTVDLTQDTDPGSFIDLKADVTMTGGEFYIRGGTLDFSRWNGTPAPQLTMSAGSVMDITDAGIYVVDNNFIENISGGLVRCSDMININATNFTPSGGTFEIYGDADNFVRHEVGSYFHNFNSNLDATYTLFPLTDIKIKGELTVSSGTFDTNSYTVTLE